MSNQSKDQAATTDWRSLVQQSQRNEEVTKIAQVLASLETNTSSSSKLGLAMRFEDAIFQAANTLQDYKKRLVKRLKKVQKNYKPSEAPSSSATSPAPAQQIYEVKEKQLRDRFGEKLKYIVFHADTAIAMLSQKDQSRASKVKLHTDQAEQWAVDLAVCTSDEIQMKLKRKAKIRQAEHIRRRPGFLEKVQEHLQQRVDNTRSHIVQIIHQDTFLEENLTKVEDMYMDDSIAGSGVHAAIQAREHIMRTLKCMLGDEVASKEGSAPSCDTGVVKMQFEKAKAMTIPFPRKGATYDEVKKISLLHIQRIKLCSNLMVSYIMLTNEGRQQVSGLLKMVYSMAVEGIRYLMEYYGNDEDSNTLQLEDVWNNMLEFHPPKGNDLSALPVSKKQKKSLVPTFKTRVLFSPGHKTPSNIVHELNSRNAILLRPDGNDVGARIIMKFEKAFEMKLFFCPLLVSIRAIHPDSGGKSGLDDEGRTRFQRDVIDGGLPSWRDSSHGVESALDLNNGDHFSKGAIISMITKKLECASAKATYVLRKCFAEIDYINMNNDFEIALAEGSALLHFLRLAKDRYLPESVDVAKAE